MSVVSSQSCFRFMDLPIELQYLIYEEALVVGKVFLIPNQYAAELEGQLKDCRLFKKPQVQLLRVCKAIHQEAEKIYLRQNLFILPLFVGLNITIISAGTPLFSKAATKFLKNLSIVFSRTQSMPNEWHLAVFAESEEQHRWLALLRAIGERLESKLSYMELDLSILTTRRVDFRLRLSFYGLVLRRLHPEEIYILSRDDGCLEDWFLAANVRHFFRDVEVYDAGPEVHKSEREEAYANYREMWNMKFNPKEDPWAKWKVKELE